MITASDFIGLDAYPYFQSAAISDAYDTFWNAVTATRNAVSASGNSGKWVWVTETGTYHSRLRAAGFCINITILGWPVTGNDYGAAVASSDNAKSYWSSVGCSALSSVHLFWYAYQDYNSSPSFGIFAQNGEKTYDTAAC